VQHERVRVLRNTELGSSEIKLDNEKWNSTLRKLHLSYWQRLPYLPRCLAADEKRPRKRKSEEAYCVTSR
jgi:hypothetical protein